jgi:hypothetical protein
MRTPAEPSMLVSFEMELKLDSSASMSTFVGSQPLCTFGTPVLEQRCETRWASLLGTQKLENTGKLLKLKHAKVAELADAPDLGSGAARRGGSSPPFRTNLFC